MSGPAAEFVKKVRERLIAQGRAEERARIRARLAEHLIAEYDPLLDPASVLNQGIGR